MSSYRYRYLFFAFILFTTSYAEIIPESCLQFELPAPKSIITTPLCTLSVSATKCTKKIRQLELQARYLAQNSDSATIISLGTISRPPFTLIWDISDIPNQLFSGASFLAEATLSNGDVEAVHRDGIFFTHQPVERPSHTIPYEISGTKALTSDTVQLSPENNTVTITTSCYWNEKELAFIIKVRDPLFYVNIPRETLASIGIEILIDPTSSRKPFPGKEVFIYAIPLSGKPYRILYKPVADENGGFTYISNTSPCDFEATITTEDFNGFTIYCPVPLAAISSALPDSIGCNIIVKTISPKNDIIRTSWVKGSLFGTYSPFLWGTFHFNPKPLYKNIYLIIGAFFLVGLLLTLLIAKIVSAARKPQVLNKFERSEAEEEQFSAIREIFDSSVINKNITLDSVAKQLQETPKKLSTLVKKFTGLTFHNYVMYSRIEVAKERLRSSHCSEASIAETCGFSNANEMEKYFMKFHRMTPYKFRSEQQVT